MNNINNNDDKQNIDILFWKVFRNIVLFKNIFSNFKNKHYYGYYDLSLDENYNSKNNNFLTYHSNAIEIITDNIKSNNNQQIIKNSNNIISIIKNVNKNNEKTRSFYNLLFKTYSTPSTPSTTLASRTNIQFDQQFDLWIYRMVNSINFVALDQYFKYFNFNSDEVKKYLEINLYSWFFNYTTYYKLKIYNYLKSNGCIDESHFKIISIGDLNEYLSFNNKFKKLIKSYKLIIEYIKQQQQQDEEMNIKYKKYGDKFYKLVLELNEIQINQFTNDQLNSTVIEILKNNKNSGGGGGGLNEIIKKYIKSIYLFYKDGKNNNNFDKLPFDYYIYFKNNDYILKKIINSNFISYNEWNYLFEEINDKLELVLNILNSDLMKPTHNKNNGRIVSKFQTFIQAILSSNNKELIETVLDKLLYLKQQNQLIEFNTNFSKLIIENLHLIKNKEILELLYNNDKFRNECGLFIEDDDNSNNWLENKFTFGKFNENIQIIQHYENLLSRVGKKYSFRHNNNNRYYFQSLNRVILKPSVYSFDFNTFIYYYDQFNTWDDGKEYLIIEFLSNVQFKKTINLDTILDLASNSKSTNISFFKFLFQNISKETISNKINENKLTLNQNFKCIIELTATINYDSNSSCIDSSSQEFKYIFIGKTKSFNFQVSLKTILLCLYRLGRIDDIIYIFNTTPDVTFTLSTFEILSKSRTGILYNSCSIYYLELFINYFINYLKNNSTTNNNNDNNTVVYINHLYYCLSIASNKGFTQIFNNIISSSSSPENCKLLLKSSIFEISNLLIKSIDLSLDIKETLTELLKNKLKK